MLELAPYIAGGYGNFPRCDLGGQRRFMVYSEIEFRLRLSLSLERKVGTVLTYRLSDYRTRDAKRKLRKNLHQTLTCLFNQYSPIVVNYLYCKLCDDGSGTFNLIQPCTQQYDRFFNFNFNFSFSFNSHSDLGCLPMTQSIFWEVGLSV